MRTQLNDDKYVYNELYVKASKVSLFILIMKLNVICLAVLDLGRQQTNVGHLESPFVLLSQLITMQEYLS